MVVKNVTVNNCTPETIVIGRRGTFETMQVVFDLTYLIENYGDGAAVLALKRSQDSSAYPAVAAQDGNTLTWVVSEVDTYYVGAGECQLMWYVDGGLAKTIIYPLVVMRDILSTSEEAPDAYQTWVDDLTALGAETLENAQNAAQSASDAESAKDDAVTAKEAAEEAAEKAEEASVHAPVIQGGYWYIWNNGQYVNTGVQAEGQKGDKGDPGEKGETGNGIASITKTGTSGLVDTYTVTYTDGTTTTFTVTNGAKGDKGDTGATGNGIQSITKTGTSGNVDTYTITYTNGQTTTFTVTNGAVSSVAGKTGAVTLDANDVAFSESGTYDDGTVGKELSDQKNAISQKAPVIINTASGDVASFTDGADGMPVRKIVGTIVPVQAGTGDPSPTNIRSISGWTGCNAHDSGKNQLNTTGTNTGNGYVNEKYLDSSGELKGSSYDGFITEYIPLKADTTYMLSSASGSAPSICFYDSTKQFISGINYNKSSGTKNISFTTPANTAYCRASVPNAYKDAMMLEIGSSATDYVPFAGNQTLPINWQSEAGTIYSGNITLNEDGSVDIVADKAWKIFDGTDAIGVTNWQSNSSSVGWLYAKNTTPGIRDVQSAVGNLKYILCDRLAHVPYASLYTGTTPSIAFVGSAWGFGMRMNDTSLTTASAINAWLSANPVKVVYRLATPQTYHISDVGSLSTYLGTNNVWIDTGVIMECDYPADTKLYIDGLTAPDEDMIADANIASGKYFVVNNQLYLSTAAIAAGASIVPGTNCTATNLAEALNALNT